MLAEMEMTKNIASTILSSMPYPGEGEKDFL